MLYSDWFTHGMGKSCAACSTPDETGKMLQVTLLKACELAQEVAYSYVL